MASGAPVITSMTSSIPEVVGDAALLVSPNDAEEIANKMALVIESPELRASMVKKGFEQIEKFKWSRVARNTLIIYHEVVNNTTEQGRNRALERCYIPFDQWKKLATLDT
jgi:glycosyltransferase involved in cell wall biosynthesis